MLHLENRPAPPLVQDGAKASDGNLTFVVGLLVSVMAASILGLWLAFDHRMPGIDEAGHILNSFQCADLISHPKFWKTTWWCQLLTVNQFYPPFIYIFNATLKLLCGPGYWVDDLSLIFFSLLLTGSVFAVTVLTTRSITAAVIAGCVINLYPQLSHLSHSPLLDFPLVAMIALGVFALVWFQDSPSWRRAWLAALALSAACLSKQVASSFLIGTGLICLLTAAVSDYRARQFKVTPKVLVIPLAVGAACAPWTVINYDAVKQFARYNESAMGALPLPQAFFQNASFYLAGLPHVMTPILFAAFLLSVTVVGFTAHRRLLPISASAAGGLVLMCLLTWTPPLDRYLAPILIASAVYTGAGLAKLLLARSPSVKVAVCACMVLAGLQFISFNFTPYPLSGPGPLLALSSQLGGGLRLYRGGWKINDSPKPPQDWQQYWVMDLIADTDGANVPVWLNIMPCTPELNVHTFELIAHEKRYAIRPTTSRMWTVMGDNFVGDESSLLYYHWYLLKTGEQGNIMKDRAGDLRYARVVSSIKDSGKFKLMAERRLPDGSTLALYRQK